MALRFTEIDLKSELQQSLEAAGYTICTPIQELTLPESLLGHDLMGVAKTGTGKTAAFLIPILQAIEPGGDPQALVICPTRELALQVGGEAEKLGRRLGVQSAVMYGGTSMGVQKQQLLGGVDLVVGTPGRLLDFMTQAYLPMRRIRWLVLDEADRMLDMGFIDDVDKILRRVPMSRQTMLFSATLPPPILALAQRYMLYPKEFRIDVGTMVPEGIAQVFYRCPHGRKVDMLRAVLKAESPDKALIFTATKVSTSEIARRLRSDGHEVYPISSNLRQADRERVLDGFRQGTIRMLVATDVAARGIDIDDITHVINLELPMEPEDYVHRIGRTGRVERLGRAISFVDSRDEACLRQIEKLLGVRFEVGVIPGFEAREGAAHHERGERRGGGRRGESGAHEGRGRAGRGGGRARGSGETGRGGGEHRAPRAAHARAHGDSPRETPGEAEGGADRSHESSAPAGHGRGGHARDHAPHQGREAAKKTHEGAPPPSTGGRSRGSRGRGRRRRPGGAGGGRSSA